MIGKPADEEALITFLHQPEIKDNLYKFVMAAYPWEQPGTPLQYNAGPRAWQKDDLIELSDHILEQQRCIQDGRVPTMFKKGTAAGRGPGKSSYVGWVVDWMMTTRIGSTTIITANTENQLKTKTFAEIGKWTNLLINRHWFEQTVLSIRPAPWFGKVIKEQLKIDTGYYYAQGQLWSEENPDAFAGAHNPLGMLVIFDEASGIPSTIFTVTSFFFTEQSLDRYWLVYSNPRRNSGGFYDIFHGNDPTWKKRHIDIRTVEGIDPKIAETLIEEKGIESDEVRIEVLGEFPKQGVRQFIGNELVREAQNREVIQDHGAPLLMGVDVARDGADQTVIRFRQGRDARSIPVIRYSQRDNMFIANELAIIIDKFNPDAVNIDSGGGAGVIDRLRELKYKVNEIKFGEESSQPEWAFKRTEMWADMRTWLGGGGIDKDARLFGDLTAPECHPFGKEGDKTILQSKDEMRKLGYRSPDDGDALALTFAVHVSRKDTPTSKQGRKVKIAQGIDYPIFDV